MGLAASQARLLTLTSRLSSIELREQMLANAKILLANDSEEVSNKYTKALNNQTLKMSDGTNEIAMTYDTLKSFGYEVKRTGDGVVASSTSATSANASANAKKAPAKSDPEVSKWVGKPAPTPPEDFTKTPPTAPAQRLSAPTAPSASNVTVTAPSFKEANEAATQCANYSYNYNKNSWNMSMTDTMHQSTARRYKDALDTNLSTLIQNLSSQGFTQTVDSLNKNKQQADNAYRMSSAVNFGYGSSDYGTKDSFTGKVKTPENEYASTMSRALRLAESIAQTEAETLTVNKNNANNTSANAQYQADLAAYNQNKQEWDKYDSEMTVYNSELSAYNTKYAEYNKDYENWKTANTSTVNTTDGASSAGGAGGAGSAGGSGSSSQAQALAQQLKANPQFLIQGLLSGYLTLTKDGQDVSLSSATNILEQYDKTDDAAAEAEYNAQMAKINRKEKIIDQQMKNLDTEHSAMQQEIESVKSIIKDHADKDFNLFG